MWWAIGIAENRHRIIFDTAVTHGTNMDIILSSIAHSKAATRAL